MQAENTPAVGKRPGCSVFHRGGQMRSVRLFQVISLMALMRAGTICFFPADHTGKDGHSILYLGLERFFHQNVGAPPPLISSVVECTTSVNI